MEPNHSPTQAALLSILSKSLDKSGIIWLENSTTDAQDNLDIHQQLREISSQVTTFGDSDECERYVRSLSKEDRVLLVASETLAPEILPRVNDVHQLTSIYIYSHKNSSAEPWREQYPKVSEEQHIPRMPIA